MKWFNPTIEKIKNIITINSNNNFYFLFFTLVTILFVSIIFNSADADIVHHGMSIFLLIAFAIEIRSLKHKDSWQSSIYVLAFIVFSLMISKKYINPNIYEYIHHTVFLIFFLRSFISLLSQIFSTKRVNGNILIATVAGYLQLGLIWSFIYLLLFTFDHSSFNGLTFAYWSDNFSEVTYFSFVTLTTLGYGDITPNSPLMQFFVFAEAIAGVFYMAIIVAIIVSARLNEHR
jgi:hypothetical protein